MAVYKKVRKSWLKQLTKKQKKQFKDYMQDVYDSMLCHYAETIRLKWPGGNDESITFPIDETGIGLDVTIRTHYW